MTDAEKNLRDALETFIKEPCQPHSDLLARRVFDYKSEWVALKEEHQRSLEATQPDGKAPDDL